MKSNITQIAKSLEKLFNAGFTDDKSIQAMKIEDIQKIEGVTMQDVFTIIKFKKAIRGRTILKFLTEGEIEEKKNERIEEIKEKLKEVEK